MSDVETTTNKTNPTISDWITFSKGLIQYILVYLILYFWICGSYIIYLNKVASLLNVGISEYKSTELNVSFYNDIYSFKYTDILKKFKTPNKYWWCDIITLIPHYFYTSIYYQTIYVNVILQFPQQTLTKFPQFLQILLAPLLLIIFCILNMGVTIAVAFINFFYVFLLLVVNKDENGKTYTTERLSTKNWATIMTPYFWRRIIYDIILFFLLIFGLPGLIPFYIMIGSFLFFYILTLPGISCYEFSFFTLLKQVITNNNGLFYWIFTYGVFLNFKQLNKVDGAICLIIMLIFGYMTIIKPAIKHGGIKDVTNMINSTNFTAVATGKTGPGDLIGVASFQNDPNSSTPNSSDPNYTDLNKYFGASVANL